MSWASRGTWINVELMLIYHDLAGIRQSDDAPMDRLLHHVRELAGSDQLDDDFSIFEAKF